MTPVSGAFIFTYNGSTSPPTRAGTYSVVATFISSDLSYANATATGSMTIAAVAPTFAVSPTSFVYDGTGHRAVVTALGIDQATPVAGTVAVTYNGSAAPPVNAGTYQVSATFTSTDPNYLSTSTTSSITILRATPSVGLLDGNWVFTYDGMPRSVVGSAVGIDGVTPITGSFTYDYYNEYGSNTMLFGPPLPGPPTDAGYYTFSENFTSLDPNYADGTYSWNLQIDPAESTLTVGGGPYTYNGSGRPATVSVVGVDGITAVVGATTVTYNGSTTVPSAAGIYAVHADFNSGDPNYYGSSGDGTLEIDKATPAFSNLSSPTVNVGAASVTVSGHIAAGSAAPNGDAVTIILAGVTQSVSVSSSGNFSTSFNTASLAAGTYPIIYEFLGDATRFNAAGTGTASGTLTVRGAPTILVNPIGQTVSNGAAVTFTATASGSPAPTVLWQVSTNGATFTNISGATAASYTFTPTAADNGKQFRAVFTNSLGSATTTAASLAVVAPVTVAAVQVNDGSAQRSEVRSITVTFSGPVSFAGGTANAAAAFQLLQIQTGNSVVLASAVATDGQGRTVVTLFFSGAETDPVSIHNGLGSLADGRYSLAINSGAVNDANGAALDGNGDGLIGGNYVSPTDTVGGGAGQLRLFRLFGDVTGNGIVDQQDLGQFRTTFNLSASSAAYIAALDANNDGTVDQLDLGQFRKRFNLSVF